MDVKLPIDDILPNVVATLMAQGRLVLQAPPGAGKTTRVPLALLDGMGTDGKIIMLEPRRLAAIAAAERMAETLGQTAGETVGYRIRGQSRVGPNTQIEVVTEGILTRMIQSDPELSGISTIIFDEFHERSLNADLGLALTWEVKQALRDDLNIVVMSATLDADPVAKLLDDAPILTSQGRSFPVDMVYLPKPLHKDTRFETAAADLVVQAVGDTQGAVLVFLPGEREIRQVEKAVTGRLPKSCVIRPLMGALSFAEQQLALKPDTQKRKIVLATAIAETSLTIPDVRVVVDCGKSRRARFDPGRGMSGLVTEPVSRAEATQRAGRAGRVAQGICYRMWAKAQDGTHPAFAPPEIEIADLAPMALDLAQWGSGPDDLCLLTPPPAGQWAAAQALLHMLGALKNGRITEHGKAIAKLPMHPRLGTMLIQAGRGAAYSAALLSEGSRLRLPSADIAKIAAELARGSVPPIVPKVVGKSIMAEAKRFARLVDTKPNRTPAQALALAYPDQIAKRRKGDTPRYLLANGSGAALPDGDGLGNQSYLVIADMGKARKAGQDPIIRQAMAISEGEITDIFDHLLTRTETCQWSKRERRVVAQQEMKLGAIALTRQKWKNPPVDLEIAAMCTGIRQIGLRLSPKVQRLQAQIALAGDSFPDLGDDALLDGLENWLAPYLSGITTEAAWKAFDPLPALEAHVGWNDMQRLNGLVPASFTTPLGRKIPIDYTGDTPAIDIRLQELFGQTTHPTVNGTPLKVTLLSPARRPIQVTMDIPGFWSGSYADVRKDMRAQYPKHPWPEDPTQADPTLRANRRKT